MKLKLVCLNTWLGGYLFDEITAFLREQNPDILLLQEVYNGDPQGERLFKEKQYNTLSELKALLGYQYSHFAPALIDVIDGQEIIQGNAVLSRFPLEEKEVSFYDVELSVRDPDDQRYELTPRNLQQVIAHVGERQLHVLNTQGIWGTHGNDTQRRLSMADHILKRVADHSPLILGGDFNVNQETKSIQKIESKLVNVFQGQLKTSFNLQRKNLEKDPGFATAVVDMLFVSSDITVVTASVPQVDISDHLPLVCEIELSTQDPL